VESLFYYALMSLLSYLLAPKPKSMPPAAVGDGDIPIAEEGGEIPVLFGTRDIGGANVVWYGDIRTVAIKSKGGKK
jgi:hypothetical protein